MYNVAGLPAGIYLRLSDDREGRALGVERQEQDCRALAARLGVDVVEVYSDNDISASAISGKVRPNFERFMHDLGTGRIKLPIAYTTSRLTRDYRTDPERVIKIAQKTGISPWYVASPWYDLTTAAGRRGYRGQAVNDTGESEDIQERIKREKQQQAEAGKTNGGVRPYALGLVLGTNPLTGREVRDRHQLVPNEVAVLLEFKARTLGGDSTGSCVVEMNRRGIPTVKGKRWSVAGYRRTMLNETYVIFDDDDPEKRGTRIHGDKRYRAMWPGIFTREEHDALKIVFADNYTPYGKRATTSRAYSCAGLLRCGLCGSVMTGNGRTDNGKYVRRYICKKWGGAGELRGCGKVFRSAEPVEHFISQAVLYRFDTPEINEALAPADQRDTAANLVRELAKLGDRKKKLAQEHAVDPYDDYQVMVTTLKTRIEALQRELELIRTAEARKALLPAQGALREAYAKADVKWRNTVIKLIVDYVEVLPGHPGNIKYEGWKFDTSRLILHWKA